MPGVSLLGKKVRLLCWSTFLCLSYLCSSRSMRWPMICVRVSWSKGLGTRLHWLRSYMHLLYSSAILFALYFFSELWTCWNFCKTIRNKRAFGVPFAAPLSFFLQIGFETSRVSVIKDRPEELRLFRGLCSEVRFQIECVTFYSEHFLVSFVPQKAQEKIWLHISEYNEKLCILRYKKI